MAGRIETKSIVIAAITIALTVAIAPFPYVFMLPMLFTCTTRGLRMSLFMGLAFGLISLMYAFVLAATPAAIVFMNQPWIPIFPRVLVAFFAHSAFVLTRRLIKPDTRAKFFAPYAISGAVGALTNTILILGCFVLFARSMFGDSSIGAILLLFAPNMAIEFVFYTIAVPIVSVSVEVAVMRKRLPLRKIEKTEKIEKVEELG